MADKQLVLPNTHYIAKDTDTAPVALSLDAVAGKQYEVRNNGSSGNLLTVTYGVDVIEIPDGDLYYFVFDGVDWSTLSGSGGGGGSSVVDGVLGETVDLVDLVYFSNDGKLYIADNTTSDKSYCAGFVLGAGVLDDPKQVQKSGMLDQFTGLTVGAKYFLGTAGAIVIESALVPGTSRSSYVGRAVTTTCMDVSIEMPNDDVYLQEQSTALQAQDITLQDQINEIITGSQSLGVSEETSFAYDVGNTGGLMKWALNNAISQANFSVHFANIGHKYNDQHVAQGDADLSVSSTLFYPTPVSDKTHTTGWINRSDWTNVHLGDNTTKNVDSNVNHGLNSNLAGLNTQVLVSTDGAEGNSFEIINSSNGTANTGLNLNYIDNDNIEIQTGVNGLLYTDASGASSQITTSDWYYKIDVIPKDNIISGEDRFWYTKVESITPSGETVSALQYNTGFIPAISGFENKILGTTYGGDLDISSLNGIVGLKDVIVKLEISTDGTEANSFESQVSYESTSASQQDYGTKLKFIDANTLRLSTGLHGLLTLVDGTGVTDVIDSETYYYRVTVIKANAVATYADTTFRQVITINDAVDVTITLPDATTTITERTYKRRGTGTGKVLFETVLSQKIDTLDPDQYELRDEVEVTFMPYAGNYEQKQVIKDWVILWEDQTHASQTKNLPVIDGKYKLGARLSSSTTAYTCEMTINTVPVGRDIFTTPIIQAGNSGSYTASTGNWYCDNAVIYPIIIEKWQDRVKLAGL